MSIAKVVEISAESEKSFEDAIRSGIERANKTLRNIQGFWVNEMEGRVNDGRISVFRVNLKVTFVLE